MRDDEKKVVMRGGKGRNNEYWDKKTELEKKEDCS